MADLESANGTSQVPFYDSRWPQCVIHFRPDNLLPLAGPKNLAQVNQHAGSGSNWMKIGGHSTALREWRELLVA